MPNRAGDKPVVINIYSGSPDLGDVMKKLDKIVTALTVVESKEDKMSVELDTLTAQVEANENLENSAITLIQGIAAQLAAIKDDPTKIQALADSLKTSADALSAAIVANTPAA